MEVLPIPLIRSVPSIYFDCLWSCGRSFNSPCMFMKGHTKQASRERVLLSSYVHYVFVYDRKTVHQFFYILIKEDQVGAFFRIVIDAVLA